MAVRKVKYLEVTSKAAGWADNAPFFSFNDTWDKEALKAAVLARKQCRGHATLLLGDQDGDFAEWNEPLPIPASGTICVKVAIDSAGGQPMPRCTSA